MSGSVAFAENNPLAAEAFQNRIRQSIEVIRNHPEAGRGHEFARLTRISFALQQLFCLGHAPRPDVPMPSELLPT